MSSAIGGMGVTSASVSQVKVSPTTRLTHAHRQHYFMLNVYALLRTTFSARTTGLLVPLRLTEWKDLMPEFAVFCFRFCSPWLALLLHRLRSRCFSHWALHDVFPVSAAKKPDHHFKNPFTFTKIPTKLNIQLQEAWKWSDAKCEA